MATKELMETGWRTDPMYTFGEAAHLAGLSAMTVRNWIMGSSNFRGSSRPPLLSTKKHEGALVSFLQLIEIMVAARLRKAEGASFHKVRTAHLNAQEHLNLEYPFAHIDLVSIGGHIVNLIRSKEADGSFQALDSTDQWSFPGIVEIGKVASEIEYAEELAARWWPDGKDSIIVIDPRISSGAPTIAGRGVTAAAICSRFLKARESVDFIMQDFQLEREQVEAALRYGERLAA